jgi:Tol biopolymer transport system component/DNA-binding winged helix-turn-helix (wHTH) protein
MINLLCYNGSMSDFAPVRFGAFELDLRTGELRKHGIRLKLQDQPFQVLRALVERPGELVTREEIQRGIWADGTFVDFDQSLNRAVNKVREALGDTAENPRYIETLARRGYRFIAPVEGATKPVVPTASQVPVAGRAWGKIAWVAAGVLAATGAALWLARDHTPLPPPRLVQLTTYPGFEWTPAFSPDGKHVAFCWEGEARDNPDVYVQMVGSVTPLRLTSDPAYDGLPAWSPDGRQIAFSSRRDGGGIYVVSPDGGPQRKVTEVLTSSRPAWTPDGKNLLVAKVSRERQPAAGEEALLLVPVDGGSAPRPLLIPPGGTSYRAPALAPDGHSLAVVSCTGASRGQNCGLQIAGFQAGPVSAGTPREIAETRGMYITAVAWSPDGSSLIYSSGTSATNGSLWRVNVRDGKEPEKLHLAGDRAIYPAIDFQNGRLAFMRSLSTVGLWRLDLGGKTAPFLPSSGTTDSVPQYSPDGLRVAFGSDRNVANMAVWMANADGTGAAQITNIASLHSATPRWSPDGRWLAFDAFRKAGGWDVWVVEASGSSPRQMTHGPADNIIPSWSRDGSSIYFASNRSGRFEIWRMPVGGGAARQVTRSGGHTAFESTDGTTLFYTLSDGGSEGIYAKLLPDGEERQVVKEGVAQRGFAVFNDGIFYLHQRARNSLEIRFHEFASGRSRVVSDIAGALHVGFTVSPDRKTFLFSKWTDVGSDLMMIENFR